MALIDELLKVGYIINDKGSGWMATVQECDIIERGFIHSCAKVPPPELTNSVPATTSTEIRAVSERAKGRTTARRVGRAVPAKGHGVRHCAMPRQISMTATKFIVKFNEHVAAKQVAGMAT